MARGPHCRINEIYLRVNPRLLFAVDSEGDAAGMLGACAGDVLLYCGAVIWQFSNFP